MNKEKILFNKENIIVAIIGIVIAIAIVLGIIFIPKAIKNNKEKKKEEKNIQLVVDRKKELEEYLKDMGKDWYEDFYYPQLQDGVSKWKDTGISSSLENFKVIGLEEFINNEDKFVNPVTDEECDYEKTKVIIKPSDPFGKENYELSIEIECGFEDYE